MIIPTEKPPIKEISGFEIKEPDQRGPRVLMGAVVLVAVGVAKNVGVIVAKGVPVVVAVGVPVVVGVPVMVGVPVGIGVAVPAVSKGFGRTFKLSVPVCTSPLVSVKVAVRVSVWLRANVPVMVNF